MRADKKYTDYLVSEDGDVYSIFTLNRFGKFLRKKPFKLKPSIGSTGYPSVMLGSKLNGEAKRMSVHRLVAINYIPNPENKPFVNHKDGNKLNNNVTGKFTQKIIANQYGIDQSTVSYVISRRLWA